ncbi:hypothetical protein JTB14_007171 [Gonioctena quinquepunctata]|nr:hypothetical protein JTB14_007171 [Gonioctena quinquepunctata]
MKLNLIEMEKKKKVEKSQSRSKKIPTVSTVKESVSKKGKTLKKNIRSAAVDSDSSSQSEDENIENLCDDDSDDDVSPQNSNGNL